MSKAGRTPEGKPYTIKSIIGFVTSWRTLLFTLIFMIQPFGSQPFTAFVFWLKAHNKKGKPPVYTIAQIVSHTPHNRSWWVVNRLLIPINRTSTRQSAMLSQQCTL
jgi:ACS family pantothenate transporter-like MFS transporter